MQGWPTQYCSSQHPHHSNDKLSCYASGLINMHSHYPISPGIGRTLFARIALLRRVR